MVTVPVEKRRLRTPLLEEMEDGAKQATERNSLNERCDWLGIMEGWEGTVLVAL